MHPYERFMSRHYLANALRNPRFVKTYDRGHDFYAWICNEHRALRLPMLRFPKYDRDDKADKAFARRWQEWRQAAITAIAAIQPPEKSPLQKRIDRLASACCLNDSQTFLLGLLARLATSEAYKNFVGAMEDHLRCCSCYYGLREIAPIFDRYVNPADLKESAPLLRMGMLVKEDGDRDVCASDFPARQYIGPHRQAVDPCGR